MDKKLIDDVEAYLPNLFDRVCRHEKVQEMLTPFIGCEMTFQFKKDNSLSERTQIFEELIKKYPGKIPIIVEHPNSKKILKFLMNYDEIVATLIVKIRSHFKILSTKSIFLMLDTNKLIMGSQRVGEIYQDYLYESEDRFMYVMVCSESTFGN